MIKRRKLASLANSSSRLFALQSACPSEITIDLPGGILTYHPRESPVTLLLGYRYLQVTGPGITVISDHSSYYQEIGPHRYPLSGHQFWEFVGWYFPLLPTGEGISVPALAAILLAPECIIKEGRIIIPGEVFVICPGQYTVAQVTGSRVTAFYLQTAAGETGIIYPFTPTFSLCLLFRGSSLIRGIVSVNNRTWLIFSPVAKDERWIIYRANHTGGIIDIDTLLTTMATPERAYRWLHFLPFRLPMGIW